MNGGSSETSRQKRLLALLAVAAIVWVASRGAELFYFVCDDAYIDFRYVSNAMLGRGLVWNPAPFRPVEGYTSFLWVEILRGVWAVTGVAPPESCGVLLFCCGLGSLYLAYRFMRRMELPPAVAPYRWWLLALVYVGTLTNRTFLAWLSSGLEAALFNFLFTWWLYEAWSRERRHSLLWMLRLSTSAALCALCRPDGLLVAAVTPLILAADRWLERNDSWDPWMGGAPLLAVPLHLLWRHSVYGYWVPNTYYAKYAGAWPESGARYLGSFVLEYGVWVLALLAIPWLITSASAGLRDRRSRWVDSLPLAVLAAHFAYYTFIIGGDHFEFRVYSHLVVLMFLAAAWVASRWVTRGWMAPAAVAAFILASWPIPWVHWWATRNLTARDPIQQLFQPVAQYFPAPLRPIVGLWDEWQGWLIAHTACIRQEEHKLFAEQLQASLPTREQGSTLSWEERDVALGPCVGVMGWVLPNVAIIDALGLNDAIVAHAPLPAVPTEERHMAHERRPPKGYVECFEPNVSASGSHFAVLPRERPLTDDMIRECESRRWY